MITTQLGYGIVNACRDGSAHACFVPVENVIYLPTPVDPMVLYPAKSPEIASVLLKSALVHELEHSDRGRREFFAHKAGLKFLEAFGGEVFTDKDLLSYIAWGYRAHEFGRSFREFRNGALQDDDVSDFFPPNGKLLGPALRSRAETDFLDRVEKQQILLALSSPTKSTWVRDFALGLTKDGPLDLSKLSDGPRRQVEALLRLGKSPTLSDFVGPPKP